MSPEQKIEQEIEEVLHADTVPKAKRALRGHSGVIMVSLVSFVESATPLPLVTDPFMIAAILLDRAKAVRYVIATTIASVLGGVVAYLMAYYFLDALLELLSPGIVARFQELVNGGETSTTVLTLVGAVTPIPYTTTAWVIAVLKGNLLIFIISSLLGRGLRFAIVGYCTYHFGSAALSYVKRYLWIISVFVLIAAVLYFLYKM